MPAPLAVDRDQVKMLVLSVGCTEAARQTGIKLATILQWSSRGEWLKRPEQPKLPPTMQPRDVIGVIKPVDALSNMLSENGKRTKLGLTAYAAKMAEQAAESGTIEEAPLYKAVADIHGKMFPEQQQDNGIHLSFFTISQGADNSEQVVHGHDVTVEEQP